MILYILKATKLKRISATSLMFILGLLFFNSCNQEASNKTFDADGDIFIQKRMVNNEEQYAAFYYLFGNQSMSAGQVTTPSSNNIDLSGGNFTLFKAPSEEDFSSSMISSGEYVFTATYGNEETYQAFDNFSGDEIDVPVIDSTSYNTTSDYFYVRWLSVNDAQIYNVKLYNMSGDLVYNGPSLDGDETEHVFDNTINTWTDSPVSGDQYILRLNAYLLDSDATDANWIFNFECNSYSEVEITWGE